jgi:hypothetical protein
MRRIAIAAALLAAAPLPALAGSCPSLAMYEVNGVTAASLPLSEALGLLFAGTAWKPEVLGDASRVRVSFRSVSGPLDLVLNKVVAQASGASTQPLSSVADSSRCAVAVNIVRTTPAVALGTPIRAEMRALPAGENLSDALAKYAERGGWSLRWNIDADYVLDVDLPMPKGADVIEGITWLVKTYQAQGGMAGVVPRFAKGNKVVVIEQMDVREQY